MPRFRRRIPPPLGSHVTFQVLDIEEQKITYSDDCTLGNTPGDWAWLAEPDELRRHLASYATASTHPKYQRVGVLFYGNTIEGDSVACWVKYHRSFRVEVHDSVDIGELIDAVRGKMYDKRPFHYVVEKKPRRYGWKSRPEDVRLPKLYTIIHVFAYTEKQCNSIKWGFKNADRENDEITLEIHEDPDESVKTPLKMIIDSGIEYGSWITIPVTHRKTRHVTSDYELVLPGIKDIKVDTERIEIAPFRWASVDIECDSPSGRFPSPEEPDCKIIMVGIVVRETDKTNRQILVRLSRGADDAPRIQRVKPVRKEKYIEEHYEEHIVENEKKLLLLLRAAIVVLDVRMVVTFNGDRFDWK